MIDVIISPNPILLKISQPCVINSDGKKPDSELLRLSNKMSEIMYKYEGVGLAAPQIGVNKRMIVIDVDYDLDGADTRDPLVLVNPKIVDASDDMEEANEGCLSCPGVSAPVNRHVSVTVEYSDLCGNTHKITGLELLSHCLQHEIDHLDGKTLFQTCLPSERIGLLQSYNEALERGAVPGSVE